MKNILCNFLVRTLQYFQKKFNFFAHENMKKTHTKVGYFSKIAEIFSIAKNSTVCPDS